VIGIDGVAPVRDAGVVTDRSGRIVAAGRVAEIGARYDHVVDHQILMPGVLNCHVHMTDANIVAPVPGGNGLVAWVQQLLGARGTNGTADSTTIASVLERMRSYGTVAIGEVVNDRSTLEGIRASGIRCRYIHELLAFPEERAAGLLATALEDLHDEDRISVALGLHAPYSVSSALHLRASQWSRENDRNVYEHLAEDPDERRLYESGSGPWRALLERLGAWRDGWMPPGISPIAHLDRLGVIDERYVAVHLADATAEEIARLAGRGARAILSPRSNLHITGLFPPVEAIIARGMRFALGTDGRGSSPTVDVFDEAATILEHCDALPPGRLLQALTVDGAGILQMPDLGTFSPGNAPGLISVEIPETLEDLSRLEQAIILDGRRRGVKFEE
jgi:5-methylthioadenosine/S-adenosylhomocysteine deaminase